jgi:hypothetical protein
MPKFDYFIKPGEELPDNWKIFLLEKFKQKEFEKLSKFGGRIQVSLTAPFVDRKKQNSKTEINKEFVEKLKLNPAESEEVLRGLTKKQLSRLAALLQFPITQKSTTKEIKNSLFDFINSAEKWSKISGSYSTNHSES